MTAVPSPSDLVGRMIGQFRVGQPIDNTRSGLLFSGWDAAAHGATGEPKKVWLQFVDERQAADVEALRRQVDAWRGFRHPALLPIVDFEAEPGLPAIVGFEAGDGVLLSHRLEAGRLDVVDAVQLVVAVARSLEAAHARKLVHFGVSEEHIVTPQFGTGGPLLFGIGMPRRFGRGGLSAWHYLAREQLVEQSDCDARADVYALGVLLYRCATGRYPVELADGLGADETASQLTFGSRRDPRQWFEIPHVGLSAVMERAIEPDPGRRFQTVGEFLRALQGCGLPIMEIPREKSDPKGIVTTPPPAGVPLQRAGSDERTFSPTPAPAAVASPPSSAALEVVEGGAERPKTLSIDSAPWYERVIGMVLNDVRIDSILDAEEGGMGKVFLGKHVQLPRHRVIKVGEVGPEGLERFKQEASVTALLREHGERVPEVLALGELPHTHPFNGRPYMILELVPGTSLAKVLAAAPGRRLPLIRALKITERVTDTLERAHNLGIVHRDLKPENILIEEVRGKQDANVRIIDFGISKASGPVKLAQTNPGVMFGTPGYMPPEVTLGHDTDGRADVFSVACILYEMLAGRRAFDGATWQERVAATQTTHPEPLASLRPDLGEIGQEVSDLITLGLTKNMESRPFMAQFRAALHEIFEKMEHRRHPNAPSVLKSMLSAVPPQPHLPLSQQATHAPSNVEDRDFRMRAIAPDLTRPARLQPKKRSRRAAGTFGLIALALVVAVAALTYVLVSHRATMESRKTSAAAEPVHPAVELPKPAPAQPHAAAETPATTTAQPQAQPAPDTPEPAPGLRSQQSEPAARRRRHREPNHKAGRTPNNAAPIIDPYEE